MVILTFFNYMSLLLKIEPFIFKCEKYFHFLSKIFFIKYFFMERTVGETIILIIKKKKIFKSETDAS